MIYTPSTAIYAMKTHHIASTGILSKTILHTRVSPSTYLRATSFRISSSRMTGIEILNTASHCRADRGVTWNTVWGIEKKKLGDW